MQLSKGEDDGFPDREVNELSVAVIQARSLPAVDRKAYGSAGGCADPQATVVVGLLTEDVFRFVHDETHPIKDWDVGTRERNVKALGNSLLVVNLGALGGSLVLYSLMFLTYERDASRLRRQLDRERASALDKEGGSVVSKDDASLLIEEEKERQ